MSDPKHPTAPVTELFDPLLRPAPGGDLLCVNPGGVLVIGPWRPDYLAWGFKPRLPPTVKARSAQTLALKMLMTGSSVEEVMAVVGVSRRTVFAWKKPVELKALPWK